MGRITTDERQSTANLKGEIEFRAKLAMQHVSGEVLLPDYYKKDEHDRILGERVDTTHKRMRELAALEISLSPFLELGAERGQRSLVLTNDFGADGIAIDISWHQLKSMEHFSKLFKREKLPMRICCDANHLPFRSNSFPFAFCYEFLHHFPSVAPIIKEIHRVVFGHFYFDEEPFRRLLKLVLYRQKQKIYSDTVLRRNQYVRLVESFISEDRSDEVEHGIVENDNISLTEWINAVSVFDQCDVDLLSMNAFRSKLNRALGLSNIPNLLLGGTIAALCRKHSKSTTHHPLDLNQLLGCPDCITPTENGSFDRPPLANISTAFRCYQCGFKYPCKDGVIFLLPKHELRQLYPTL
jgi:SAM-dependent methyltransferase